jgi:hypothetical protein
MLAAGLTLLHYRAFDQCPTRPLLQARIDRDFPEYRRYGIHVMVSQNGAGELVIGDSHEYGSDMEPFDRVRIDELALARLLREAASARVGGSHPLRRRPSGHRTGWGGHGMTMSFGVAEDVVNRTLTTPTIVAASCCASAGLRPSIN